MIQKIEFGLISSEIKNTIMLKKTFFTRLTFYYRFGDREA